MNKDEPGLWSKGDLLLAIYVDDSIITGPRLEDVHRESDNILKKMNRKHTKKQYFEIVEKLKNKRPDIALSSDFIVGFPGETDEDFALTMQLVKEIEFVIAYSFMFSPRPGTPAFKLKDIDTSIKKARLSALQSLLKEQQRN